MNGELRPMDWNQFKQLLDKEQKKYICAILNEYKVSTKQLADMLGVSASILRTHLKSLGVEPPRYKITDTARFRNEFCCRRHGKLEYNSTTLHYQNYNLNMINSDLEFLLKSLGVEPSRYKITDTARFRNEFCCRRHGKLEYNSTTLHYQNYNLNMINSDLEFLLSQNSNPVSITILVEYS